MTPGVIPHLVEGALNAWAEMVGKPEQVTSTVEDVTGSPARDFRYWAIDHADDFRWRFNHIDAPICTVIVFSRGHPPPAGHSRTHCLQKCKNDRPSPATRGNRTSRAPARIGRLSSGVKDGGIAWQQEAVLQVWALSGKADTGPVLEVENEERERCRRSRHSLPAQ